MDSFFLGHTSFCRSLNHDQYSSLARLQTRSVQILAKSNVDMA